MLTKEQQEMLDQVADRDGAYTSETTERGTVYRTVAGQEICVDAADAPLSEIEQLKARIAALEALK